MFPMDNLWSKEGDYVTRRFVFHDKAIATLRAKAKSELVPKPTRIEALTCFIWRLLGSKDLEFYVFRTLICIVGKP